MKLSGKRFFIAMISTMSSIMYRQIISKSLLFGLNKLEHLDRNRNYILLNENNKIHNLVTFQVCEKVQIDLSYTYISPHHQFLKP